MTAIQGLAASPGGSTDAVQHKKLADAAQQFEAMFLEQMMKPFGAEREDGDKDGEDTSAGAGTYQSLGVESMARAVSAAGGLGIARSVLASVEKQAAGGREQEIGNRK